jgi:hypothetical protein
VPTAGCLNITPYILLLQREAAFDRAAIQILDKVISLLEFKLIDC